MDLFEYQARDMFEAHGVPVLAGIVAHTPEEAKAAAEKVVKGVCKENPNCTLEELIKFSLKRL